MNEKNSRRWYLFMWICVLLIVSIACGSTTSESSESRSNLPSGQPDEAEITATSEVISSPIPEETSTPTVTPSPIPSVNLVLASNANIRSGPGKEYPVVAGAVTGDSLAIHAKNDDETWLLIDPEQNHWVFAGLGKLDGELDLVPFAPTPQATPTRTGTPTKSPTEEPTSVPAITISSIYKRFERLTELQFKEYKKEITGQLVRERVEVGNVSDQGKVSISGDWSPWLFNVSDFCVVVTGVPKDVALSLDGGDEIKLEAVVNGIVGNYSYYYNCENTLVLNYRKIEK